MNKISEREAVNGDWDNRRLCGDESCVGTIGRDGRCRECGRPSSPAAEAELVESLPAPAAYIPEQEEDRDEGHADWAERRLCEDESCIGTIGRDGRCTECGRPVPR